MSVPGAGPEVTVIVPLYEAEPYIERCLDGLGMQTLPAQRYEVLVVDNNSTDRGPSLVRGRPRVRLLRETRQGAYAARNRGLSEARGRLIAFTDPDCVPEPGWLERLIAPFEDPEVQVVNGRVLPAPGSGAVRHLAVYEHHRDLHVFGSEDPLLYFGHTNNLASRRATLEVMGRFRDRARGSDTIFVRQVADRYGCGAVRYEPGARVAHLEMDGLASYFRKGRIYRASRMSYRRLVRKRSPRAAERLAIFRDAVRSGDLPRTAVPGTAVLLVAAALYRRLPGSQPDAPEPRAGGEAAWETT